MVTPEFIVQDEGRISRVRVYSFPAGVNPKTTDEPSKVTDPSCPLPYQRGMIPSKGEFPFPMTIPVKFESVPRFEYFGLFPVPVAVATCPVVPVPRFDMKPQSVKKFVPS